MTRNINEWTRNIATIFVIIVCASVVYAAPLLDPNSAGIEGTKSQTYDMLVSDLCSNTNVVNTVGGNKLWVPWYKTSSSCTVGDLQNGGNCNSGQAIDNTHNCMVTDEFSQVGILLAMSKDSVRMDQYYNTVVATKSSFGTIPAWRVYRNGDTIEPCRNGINGNCDTASDATARIISSLFTAAANENFPSDARSKYKALAIQMSNDFLTYEVEQKTYQTSQGPVTYWLAGGSQVKRGGMNSNDYAYTGYYPDAIIAMLQAYSATSDVKYLNAAQDITKNYLVAAKWDGNTFTAPPGKAFKWNTASGTPVAECTSNCNPVVWEGYDAPRALGMCQVEYYADYMGVTLSDLDKYCKVWGDKYMKNPTNAPLQYTPSGSASGYQSSAYAQGLQALFESGYNTQLYEQSLNSALGHYSTTTNSFDWTACFGVYTNAFSVRALGMGIGRDLASFKPVGTTATPPTTTPTVPVVNNTTTTTPTTPTTGSTCYNSVKDIPASCAGGTITTDSFNGGRTVICTNGADSMKVQAWDKGGYFELYKQTTVGKKISEICLGTTCVGTHSGFAKSSRYPICTTQTQPTTPTVPTTPVNNTPTTPTTPPTTTPTNTCVNSVKDIAVTCTSTITSDTWNGCRKVVCGTNGNTITTLACDKKGYFEVYKQGSTGATPKVCFGTTCVDAGNGFAKSGSFPVCSGTTTTQPEPVPAPQPAPAPTTTCASSVKSIPATCVGGTITTDSFNGGRTIKCTNGGDSMQVQAWDKGGYFEMYKQGQTGKTVSKICIGDTCISDNGFAKSGSFPICR